MEITLRIDASGVGTIVGSRDVVTTTPAVDEPTDMAALRMDGGAGPALGVDDSDFSDPGVMLEGPLHERRVAEGGFDAGASPFE